MWSAAPSSTDALKADQGVESQLREQLHRLGPIVFGSWFLPKDRRVGDLGLLNPDYPLDFVSQLTTPLKPGLDKQRATPNAS